MISPWRHPRRPRVAARGTLLAIVAVLLVTACGSSTPSNGSIPTLQLPASGSVAPSPSATTATGPATASPSNAPSESAPASPSPSATTSTSPSASASPSSSAGTSPSAGTGALDWTDCGAPFECATLQVPIDYANPQGSSIGLALIRLPASDPSSRIGSLLTDPGGPGASGVDFVRSAQTVFSADLRAHFDIVGFDPRGVERSSPIECLDGPATDQLYELDPTPDTPAERQAIIDATKAFDAACEAHSGELLPHMTTADAARDMDRIRAAVGDRKLTYLGFSYGTFLGTVYAGLFPTQVRALALDGAIDPTLTFEQGSISQAKGFAVAFQHFLADCASRPSCEFYHGGKPQPAFDALMASIDAHPLPATFLKDPRPVGTWLATTGVIEALYAKQLWPLLAQGLALAERGDGSILLYLADQYSMRQPDGTYKNLLSAFVAVNCVDYLSPSDISGYEALLPKLKQASPEFGEATLYESLQCLYWPVRATKDPGVIKAEGAPPILVVATTGDPATPYEQGVALAKELSSGVLLTRVGDGHTAYGESACIDAKVDAYLIDLTVPPDKTTCQQ